MKCVQEQEEKRLLLLEREERRGGDGEARIVAVFGGVCLFKLAVCYCRACGCCSRDEKERREGEHEGALITDRR